MKRGYKKVLNIDGIQEPEAKLDALIAAWMLPVVEARDDETFQRRRRVVKVALNILLWRGLPKKKRDRAIASGMTGPASKGLDADMQWLRDEATPLEFREVAEMLAGGWAEPNKLHLAALLSSITARKKNPHADFQDVLREYKALRALSGWRDLPVIRYDSKTGRGSSWNLRRVLNDLGLLESTRRRSATR
jgi:hypothetical protein